MAAADATGEWRYRRNFQFNLSGGSLRHEENPLQVCHVETGEIPAGFQFTGPPRGHVQEGDTREEGAAPLRGCHLVIAQVRLAGRVQGDAGSIDGGSHAAVIASLSPKLLIKSWICSRARHQVWICQEAKRRLRASRASTKS